MSEGTVDGLAVVAIYVADLERAASFYVDVLGLVPAGDMPPGRLLKAGDAVVYLEGGRRGRAGAGLQAPTVSACFRAPSVKACWERLCEANAPVVEEYRELGPGFAMLRVEDPDGNVVEVAGEP
jgi:catechol 2,3-dioxygenase-like lactoylglutathione lyase family enzyme